MLVAKDRRRRDEPPPLPYGDDFPDAGLLWADRGGRVHRGDGPYAHLPWRVVRRKLSHWSATFRRWSA